MSDAALHIMQALGSPKDTDDLWLSVQDQLTRTAFKATLDDLERRGIVYNVQGVWHATLFKKVAWRQR